MAAEKLGGTVNDHVHTQRQRVLIQWRGEGVIRHHNGADALGCSHQTLDIEYFQRRVGWRFQIHQLATLGDFAFDFFVIERLAQGHVHAGARQELFENLVGAAIAVPGRDHPIAMGQEGVKHTADRRHPAAESHGRFGQFQLANLCFEGLDCRVAHAAVNKAGCLAQRNVIPDVDVVITIGGTDHDGRLSGVVGMPDLLPAPHGTGSRTGINKPCVVWFFIHKDYSH
ncbi:hypothetical protein D3C71_1277230 [compost metagenome]